MTRLQQIIDFAPEKLYPDRGCVAWPSCLDCPFDPCINTADKDPTRTEHEKAQVRREIILLYNQDMSHRGIAEAIGVDVPTVERGLARYRVDLERARRKGLEQAGRPILEVTR